MPAVRYLTGISGSSAGAALGAAAGGGGGGVIFKLGTGLTVAALAVGSGVALHQRGSGHQAIADAATQPKHRSHRASPQPAVAAVTPSEPAAARPAGSDGSASAGSSTHSGSSGGDPTQSGPTPSGSSSSGSSGGGSPSGSGGGSPPSSGGGGNPPSGGDGGGGCGRPRRAATAVAAVLLLHLPRAAAMALMTARTTAWIQATPLLRRLSPRLRPSTPLLLPATTEQTSSRRDLLARPGF